MDEAAGGVVPAGLAGQANTDQALAGGEDDAAVGVVPGVGLVLAHDGELDTIEGEQFFQCQLVQFVPQSNNQSLTVDCAFKLAQI